MQSADQRPLREAPDPALLARLLKASADYDMDQVDILMDELEHYRYASQAELVASLKQDAGKSALENIQERLESLGLTLEKGK
jgi:uncharacterized membrane protein